MAKPEGERIAVLEANYENMISRHDEMMTAISGLREEVKTLNNILENVKGARWMLLGLAAVGGGGVTLGINKLAVFMNAIPLK